MENGQWIDLAFFGTPRRHGRHVGKGYPSASSVLSAVNLLGQSGETCSMFRYVAPLSAFFILSFGQAAALGHFAEFREDPLAELNCGRLLSAAGQKFLDKRQDGLRASAPAREAAEAFGGNLAIGGGQRGQEPLEGPHLIGGRGNARIDPFLEESADEEAHFEARGEERGIAPAAIVFPDHRSKFLEAPESHARRAHAGIQGLRDFLHRKRMRTGKKRAVNEAIRTRVPKQFRQVPKQRAHPLLKCPGLRRTIGRHIRSGLRAGRCPGGNHGVKSRNISFHFE